jgi:hypothetical protein
MDVRTVGAAARLAAARLVVVVCAAAAVLVTVPAETASAAEKCAARILRDWSDNHRIDHVYGLTCYRAAIKALPVDVRTYSSAEDDIRRAMLYAQSDSADPGDKGPPTPDATAPTAQPLAIPRARAYRSVTPPPDASVPRTAPEAVQVAGGPIASVERAALPIPLPLIGLALVSGVLLVLGSAGYLTRRLSAHTGRDS